MFKLAIVGLDTSHSVAFPKLIQGEGDKIVDTMTVVSCMRFPSPFQAEDGQDKRQEQLEELNINVTKDFDEAVEGVDGILIEINDPSMHLEYFERAAALGKPIFLDKPLADNLENGLKIHGLAKEKGVSVWSSSSLRFTPEIIECAGKVEKPKFANVFGPLGKAASGSSLIWYGVHSFEMLSTLMGRGAKTVFAREDVNGVVSVVNYGGDRRGIVECNSGTGKYGGRAQNDEVLEHYVTAGSPYPFLIAALEKFFLEGTVPVSFDDTLEIQAMMEAASKSLETGNAETVRQA